MRINIRTKLLGGFLVVVALMITIVVVVYLNLGVIEKASDRILYEEVRVTDHVMNIDPGQTRTRHTHRLLASGQ